MQEHKKFLLAFISYVVLVSSTISITRAQESVINKKNEVYLSLNSLYMGPTFGMTYKRGIGQKMLINVGLSHVAGGSSKYMPGNSTSFETSDKDFNFGTNLGLEWRTPLSERIDLMYGVSGIFHYGMGSSTHEDPNIPVEFRTLKSSFWSTGIGVNVGVLIQIKNGFYVAGEFTPSLLYSKAKYEENVNNEIVTNNNYATSYLISNQSVKVSLVYRWAKNSIN